MEKENRLKVINSVFKFETTRGHLNWKVIDVARVSGVSRSLIYYYFGQIKSEIFHRCVELICGDFYGISEERMKAVEQGDLYGCIAQNFRFFRESPEFVVFYNKARVKKSPLRDKLIEIEKTYQLKLKTLFPKLSSSEIVALHSVLHGVVCSPILDNSTFDLVIKSIVCPFISKRQNQTQSQAAESSRRLKK